MLGDIVDEQYEKTLIELKKLEKLMRTIKVKNDDGIPLVNKHMKIDIWRMQKELTGMFCLGDYGETIGGIINHVYLNINKVNKNEN